MVLEPLETPGLQSGAPPGKQHGPPGASCRGWKPQVSRAPGPCSRSRRRRSAVGSFRSYPLSDLAGMFNGCWRPRVVRVSLKILYRNPRRPGEAGIKLVPDQSQKAAEREILEGLGFTVIEMTPVPFALTRHSWPTICPPAAPMQLDCDSMTVLSEGASRLQSTGAKSPLKDEP